MFSPLLDHNLFLSKYHSVEYHIIIYMQLHSIKTIWGYEDTNPNMTYKP